MQHSVWTWQYLWHRWSSGRILPCHGRDPGSIPGRCILETFCYLDHCVNLRSEPIYHHLNCSLNAPGCRTLEWIFTLCTSSPKNLNHHRSEYAYAFMGKLVNPSAWHAGDPQFEPGWKQSCPKLFVDHWHALLQLLFDFSKGMLIWPGRHSRTIVVLFWLPIFRTNIVRGLWNK